MKQIPITIICGYLGSGKTTLLNRLLSQREGLKVALIVNDMGAINVDSNLIDAQDTLSKTKEKLISLTNGCICCTLREDLLEEISALARSQQYDHIMIEASGISEPIPIAQTIMLGIDRQGQSLSEVAKVDSIICVVDALRLYHEFDLGLKFEAFHDPLVEEDDISRLLLEQIEFCDTLILNKIDMVSKSVQNSIRETLRRIQPQAFCLETVRCEVELSALLNTQRFDYDRVIESAGWIAELEHPHTPEVEEFGINSFVFERRMPFHPLRLSQWIESTQHPIIRSKGVIWLASQIELCVSYSQAGASIELTPAGYWVKYQEEEIQKYYLEHEPEVMKHWDSKVGDCMNQIVFIGKHLRIDEVIKELEMCLVTEEELILNDEWEDPFMEVGLHR